MDLLFIVLLFWAPKFILGLVLFTVAVCTLNAVVDRISEVFQGDKPKEIKPLPWQKDRRLICNKPIYYHTK